MKVASRARPERILWAASGSSWVSLHVPSGMGVALVMH